MRPIGAPALESTRVSGALLVAANLLPLAGVLLWGWDLHAILIVYWIESGLVGLLNVPRIALARAADPPHRRGSRYDCGRAAAPSGC